MRVTIEYDGTSIQATTASGVKTRDVEHESIDSKELKIQRLGRLDGGKLVAETFGVKRIKLRGTIIGDDQDDLETRIDNFKELLNRQQRNLDIGYITGTRRYTGTFSEVIVVRRHFNVNFAPWEATFMVSRPPFGTALDTSTIDFRSISVTGTGTYEYNATFTGTYRPMPTIKMRVNSEDMFEWVEFINVNTNGAIRVDASFDAGDSLVVNTDDFTVTLNDVAQSYTGFFPTFAQGGNDLQIRYGATTANFDVYLTYYPLYL